MTKTECFGIPFDDGEPIEIIENALSLIGSDKGVYAVTPNPEIVMAAMKDPALREAIDTELTPRQRAAMGHAGGQLMKRRFDKKKVVRAALRAIGE